MAFESLVKHEKPGMFFHVLPGNGFSECDLYGFEPLGQVLAEGCENIVSAHQP